MRRRLGPWTFVKSILRILAGRPQVPPSFKENQMLGTILRRRSVRRFADRDILDEVFSAILEAGRLAPSTVNLQTWAFSVFTPAAWRETFDRPLPFRGKRAVIVMGDTQRDETIAQGFPYCPLVEYTVAVMNASLAAMCMSLAAEALGVSSVMLSETGHTGFLDAGYLKRKLELPDRVFPLMTIVFGYARGPYPPMPPKLPPEQILFEGRYKPADKAVVDEWLNQMVAGYKASHPFSSFNAQLQLYRQKIGQAEKDLQEMVFHRGGLL